jgi:hypothetical protein
MEGKQMNNMGEILTHMEDAMLKDFMSGNESPRKRDQVLQKLNRESRAANSPNSIKNL